MPVKTLDLLVGRRFELQPRRLPGIKRHHAQLVAEDLHGRAEIERRVGFTDRHLDRHVTQGHVLIGKPHRLVAEDQRHITMRRPLDQIDRRVPRPLHRHRHFTPPGGHRRSENRSLERLGKAADDPRIGKDVVRARRTGGGNRIRECLGAYQHKMRQAHGFHGPGRCSDIAWMTGPREDDTHALKRAIVVHIKICGFPN